MTRAKTMAGLLVGLAALLSLCRRSDDAGSPAHLLEPGQTYQGRIVAGTSEKALRIRLHEGDFVQIDVEQIGIDLEASLFDPDGNLLLSIDNPSGTLGLESLWTIAQRTGDYPLGLEASNKAAQGRFAVQVNPLSLELQDLAAASRMMSEGERLKQTDLSRALEEYSKALQLWAKQGRRREESLTLSRIGSVYFNDDQLQQALIYFKKALDRIDEDEDFSTTVNYLVHIGWICSYSGDQEAASESFERVLEISRKANYERGIAFGLAEKGKTLFQRGQYEAAVLLLKDALAIWESQAEPRMSADLRIRVAQLYCLLGRSEIALDYLDTALRQARDSGAKSLEASALALTGWTHYQKGETKQAILAGEQALEIGRHPRAFYLIGASHWKHGEHLTRDGAPTALAQQHFQKSLDNLQTALQYARHAKREAEEANFLAHLARTRLSLHQPDLALRRAEESLAICSRNNFPELEMFALFVASKASFAMERLPEARRGIETALHILDGLKEETATEASEVQFLDLRYLMHEYHLQLLMELHRRHPRQGYDALALEANDRSRARSFIRSMAEARAGVREAIDPQLLKEESEARQRLREKEREKRALLNRSHASDELASINQQIRSLAEGRDQIAARIRRNHPKYAELMELDSISLNDIQRTFLDSNTALLVYAFGENDLFAWHAGPDSLRSYNLGKRELIEGLSKRFIRLISQPPSPFTQARRQALLKELSGHLIAPLQGFLGDSRLAIVADGPLHYLPFSALLKSAPGSDRPLVADHETVFLPSISALAAMRNRNQSRQTATKMIAVLADPVFTVKDKRVKRSPAQVVSGLSFQPPMGAVQLKRLFETAEEANAILAMIPAGQSRKATGFQANKQALNSLGNFRILHFATHAVIYPDHPSLSGIVLSLFNEEGEQQDGFVQAHEIYDLDLSADLVVLSACETVHGQFFRGEGIVGFTRGFMFAGAPRIVVSLWKVHDKATSALMKNFYLNLFEKGDSAPTALRKAQLALLNNGQWSDPYFWGAFALEGEWRNDVHFSGNQN